MCPACCLTGICMDVIMLDEEVLPRASRLEDLGDYEFKMILCLIIP